MNVFALRNILIILVLLVAAQTLGMMVVRILGVRETRDKIPNGLHGDTTSFLGLRVLISTLYHCLSFTQFWLLQQTCWKNKNQKPNAGHVTRQKQLTPRTVSMYHTNINIRTNMDQYTIRRRTFELQANRLFSYFTLSFHRRKHTGKQGKGGRALKLKHLSPLSLFRPVLAGGMYGQNRFLFASLNLRGWLFNSCATRTHGIYVKGCMEFWWVELCSVVIFKLCILKSSWKK